MKHFNEIFDYSHTLAAEELRNTQELWDIFSSLSEIIIKIGKELPSSEYDRLDGDIWVSKTASVMPSAYIKGPCIIGHNTEVRHCAFIRGGVLIGENAVIGNSTELKNCIIFDSVRVPHFNYIGDSILGYHAHFGAGSLTSNVKGDKTEVVIKDKSGHIKTGRKKFGALVGDYAEIGCNTVLNPGTAIGKGARIYPLCSVRGVIEANAIYKSRSEIIQKI